MAIESTKTIGVVTSLFNEERNINLLVTYIEQLLDSEWCREAVLVDNASTDHSFEELKKAFESFDSVLIVRNPSGSGWGDGIRCGMKFLKSVHVLIFPSDMQYPIEDVVRVGSAWKNAVSEGRAAVLTLRKRRRDSPAGRIRGVVWRRFLRLRFGSSVPDLCSQLRVFKIDSVNLGDLPSDFMFDVFHHLALEENGLQYSIEEVGFVDRVNGNSNLGGFVLGSWRALKSSLSIKRTIN